MNLPRIFRMIGRLFGIKSTTLILNREQIMSEYTPKNEWHEKIHQFDLNDVVEGGATGADNIPHQQLADNVNYVMLQLDALKKDGVGSGTPLAPDEPSENDKSIEKNNLSYILPQDPSAWGFNVMLYPQNTKLNRGDIIDLGQDARPTYYLPELPDDALLDIRLTGYLGYIDDRYDFESRKTIDTIIAPEGYTIKNGKIEFLSRPTPSGEQDCWRPYTTDSKNWKIALPFEVGHQFPTGLIATEDETHYPQQVIMSFYRQDGSSYEGFYWTITSPKVGARSSGGSGGGIQ